MKNLIKISLFIGLISGAFADSKPPVNSVASNSFEDCSEYKSGISSLSFSNTFTKGGDKNPFQKLENCILKAMDTGLKPVCDKEKELKALQEEYKNDSKVLALIEEDLVQVEEIKYEYADIFYETIDVCDEFVDDIEDELDKEVDKRITDKVTHGAINLLRRLAGPETEIRAFCRTVASRISQFCGSSLRRSIDPKIYSPSPPLKPQPPQENMFDQSNSFYKVSLIQLLT